MNIAVSMNSKYMSAARGMLFSLRGHSREPITVWLLNHSLSDTDIRKFEAFLRKKCHAELVVIPIDATFFDGMPLDPEGLFSIEAYYRILIPWLLPPEMDRVLWLDSDIIICGDISSFYHMDLNGHCLAACEDERYISAKTRGRDNDRLGIDRSHRYFNSGVLLMDLERIRKNYNQEDIRILAERIKDRLVFPDQDILNCLFQKNVFYADYLLFNCEAKSMEYLAEEQKSNVRILHYYGGNKPWDLRYGYDPGMRYWNTQIRISGLYALPYAIFFLRTRVNRVAWLRKVYFFLTGRKK